MGGKAEAPPAPDYSPLIKMATDQATRSNDMQAEQFDWAKQAYADNKAITDRVTSKQLEGMDLQLDQAKKSYDRYDNVAIPLRDEFIDQAHDYNSESRRESAAGSAQANVATEIVQARESARKDLEAFGLNPSATRYSALDVGLRTSGAAAQAAAGNLARDKVEQTGRDMLTQAIATESGLPAQGQAQAAGATGAGSAAAGTTLGTTQSGAQSMGTSVDYANTANGALNTSAGLTTAQYNAALDRYKTQVAQENEVWQGVGSAIGMAAGIAVPHLFPATPTTAVARAGGGIVPTAASPSRGAIPDDVEARLTAGEFVIPQDVVRWKGEEFFRRMVDKIRAIPMPGEPVRHEPQRSAIPVT